MKIALVVHDLHEHGGHSLYTKTLADELSSRHDVMVFANRCERNEKESWGFHPVRAWRLNALACVQTFPLGLHPLTKTLDDFEIRHMQGYCGGRPNIVTAHICVEAYLKSLRFIGLRSRLSLNLMAAAEARFYRHYDGTIIAVSEKVARELREFYGVRGPITVIPHGVKTKRFKDVDNIRARKNIRATLGLGDDQTLALYVGDLTKAHMHIKALAGATPDVHFAVVTKTQDYRWKMPNVHFLSPTRKLESYYRASDAFIFPTTYDAFGMVLLEAMASGLAVFSSDRAGGAELISSGVNGFVIPLDDWVEVTREKLLDKDSLQNIGRAAEKTAQRHDWSKVVIAVENLYFQAISKSS
jgi:UDP-glucose:(heptosyl)LPS alpha-1,3-glucosyltransferase